MNILGLISQLIGIKILRLTNHINNICDLRSPSHNKLVHGDKNGNDILSLARILGKFNT